LFAGWQRETTDLVVVFLNGGNDAANTVIPVGRAEHRAYCAARGPLALGRRTALPLSVRDQRGQRVALHPALTSVHDAVERGVAAVHLHVAPARATPPLGECHHRATEAWHCALDRPRRQPTPDLGAALRRRAQLPPGQPPVWFDVDGFDLHHDLLARHDRALRTLDRALGEWMRTLDRSRHTTLIVASEFGRSLRPHGTGADHGSGAQARGHVVVLGGRGRGRGLRGSVLGGATGPRSCGELG